MPYLKKVILDRKELYSAVLNEYLEEVFKNSDKCKYCVFNHNEEFCFFAYECVKENFSFYKKKKE